MMYIRADANREVGTGHIMRCLSIADAARNLGEDTVFIIADPSAEELLKKRNYPYIVLNSKWNDLDFELALMFDIIHKNKIKKLLIDSYYVTEQYLEELRKHVYTMYIDDLNKINYPVDCLVCYAPYYENFHYTDRYKNTKLLLGTKYAPLRQEFIKCNAKCIPEKIDNLLITSGGSDNFGFIDKMLADLDKGNYQRITALCGVYYDGFEHLIKKYEPFPSVSIKKNVNNIKQYMEESDVVISAGGTTLYELAAVGVPTISYILADNQIDSANWWDKQGIISCAGNLKKDNVVENAIRLLETDYRSYKQRRMRSDQMKKMIDGKGAQRIAQAFFDI